MRGKVSVRTSLLLNNVQEERAQAARDVPF